MSVKVKVNGPATSGLNDALMPSSGVFVYPNPTDGMLTLKMRNGEIYKGPAEVYDMTGRLVIRRQMDGTTHLDISELTIGQYILKSRISTVLIRKTE
jgi:hypothetical protein